MFKIYAQDIQIPWGDSSQTITGISNFKFQNIGNIVFDAIPLVFAASGFGLLLMILSAGFALMTGGGDAKKMETGKQRLTYAIVGFIIIFVAYWMTQIAGIIFGIDEIKTIFQ